MIDTASLMRLNLVQTERYGMVRISSVLTNSVWILSNDTPSVACNMKLSDLTPIVITGKILSEWCGFKNIIGSIYKIPISASNTLFLQVELKDKYFAVGIKNEAGYITINHFKKYHIHQLQNLYYALTGQELEIKLPID